jgi:hypothetical protein
MVLPDHQLVAPEGPGALERVEKVGGRLVVGRNEPAGFRLSGALPVG